MAKLSARNRTTIAEASREYTKEQLQARADKRVARDYPDGTWTDPVSKQVEPIPDSIRLALTIWERRTLRLMSDGTVLEKVDVRFQPDWLDKQGRRHSYGWKVYGTMKDGKGKADFLAIYAKPMKDGSPSPWTIGGNTGHAAPVISRARIMAAVKADDGTGFCQACGAEQLGCEPDATNYKCESCGQMEVYGAQEMLLSL